MIAPLPMSLGANADLGVTLPRGRVGSTSAGRCAPTPTQPEGGLRPAGGRPDAVSAKHSIKLPGKTSKAVPRCSARQAGQGPRSFAVLRSPKCRGR